MSIVTEIATALPRRLSVPSNDDTDTSGQSDQALFEAKPLYVRVGEIIDVGWYWKDWLDKNTGKIATSAWAAHASSPQSPTLGTDGIDQTRAETLVLVDASGATAGDIYWITNTVTVTDSDTDSLTMGTRTLKRTLAVKVIK